MISNSNAHISIKDLFTVVREFPNRLSKVQRMNKRYLDDVHCFIFADFDSDLNRNVVRFEFYHADEFITKCVCIDTPYCITEKINLEVK